MVAPTIPNTDFSLLPSLGSSVSSPPIGGPSFSDQFSFGGGNTPQGSGAWSPTGGGFGDTPQGSFSANLGNEQGGGAWDSFSNWLTGGVDSKTGEKTASGAGQIAGLGIGALNAWSGFQNLKLGREQLEQTRQSSDRNFANQVSTTNRQLEDRQRSRVAQNPGSALSVADYMSKYKVS